MIKDMFREAVNPLDHTVMARQDFAVAAAESMSAPVARVDLGFDNDYLPGAAPA